jgi:phenylpropionate dioxygenase-like ring-hydroxylating dioxygenase large terminal subunit
MSGDEKINQNEFPFATKRWFPKHPELGTPGRIPVDQFTSPEQFAREQKNLWPHVWLLAGRVEELPDPGDYLIRDVPACSASVIVVRGRDGVVRAFHNVCTHRGAQICWQGARETGSTATFRCPYHGFTFNLEGQLTFVPDEKNFYDLDKKKMGLVPIQCEIWNGFIYIHLAPDPKETLVEYLGEVGDRLKDYPFSDRTYFFQYTAEIAANWKVLLASFQEQYHGHTFHTGNVARSPSKYNPFSHTRFIDLLGKHRIISLARNPNMTPTRVEQVALDGIASSGYDRAWRGADRVVTGDEDVATDGMYDVFKSFICHNIFPNLQLNTVGGVWYYYQFWPIAVDKVRFEVRMYYPQPKTASDRFFVEMAKVRDRDILSEDGHVSERQQPLMRSGAIKDWVLQDEEIAIQHFNYMVMQYAAGEPAQGAGE